MKKRLYLETTEVPAARTAAEIDALLVDMGARAISKEYGPNGSITAMHFVLLVNNAPHSFRLPVRTATIQKYLGNTRDTGKAERIAWRQMYRWIQAQLAMIQCGMVQAREVFLPYLQDASGRTLFEVMDETQFKALPAPKQ